MPDLIVRPVGCVQPAEDVFCLQLAEQYAPALQGLAGFSHIQILWWFDGNDNAEARSVLQVHGPYRTLADASLGVFASRSPARPNPLALSVARVLEIDQEKACILVDYLDAQAGSPILDIKPYQPSLDRVEQPQVPDWCRHWPHSLEASATFDWENEFRE